MIRMPTRILISMKDRHSMRSSRASWIMPCACWNPEWGSITLAVIVVAFLDRPVTKRKSAGDEKCALRAKSAQLVD